MWWAWRGVRRDMIYCSAGEMIALRWNGRCSDGVALFVFAVDVRVSGNGSLPHTNERASLDHHVLIIVLYCIEYTTLSPSNINENTIYIYLYTIHTMKLHSLKIMDDYIQDIIHGRKIVEGRIYKPKYELYVPNDKIVFTAPSGTTTTCRITQIKRYSSFGEMLKDVAIHSCLPSVHEYQAAVDVYNLIYWNQKEEELKCGVIAISFERC